MRVHRQNVDEDGKPKAGAFTNQPTDQDGMSTDWDMYSVPVRTRERGRVPSDNAVIKMNVGKVRGLPGQRVQHSPSLSNRAHTDVFGDKRRDPEVRLKLRQMSIVVLAV